MQYTVSITAFLALASSVLAQNPTNGFDVINKPGQGEVVPAGAPYIIQWTAQPTSAGNVTISLLAGPSQGLLQLQKDPIATGVNSLLGNYHWQVPATLGSDSTYGIKISLDSDPNTFQYSNPFSISKSSSSSSGSSSSASGSVTASGMTSSGTATVISVTTSGSTMTTVSSGSTTGGLSTSAGVSAATTMATATTGTTGGAGTSTSVTGSAATASASKGAAAGALSGNEVAVAGLAVAAVMALL